MIVRSESRLKRIVLWFIAIGILAPACYGFTEKLILFILAVRRDQIAGFTIIPIANYLIVTAGMFCLLIWAAKHGMFRNVEQPKYDMLRREAELDRREGRPWSEEP
ncbi:MAG: hypothetical protein HUU22_07330 [Phycisphaerae bacterium]|nr:hypothetical protein [Phycisphaerae bacterium]NUQ45829.1 hypothetical protein [Phycisphaerae bacterium]